MTASRILPLLSLIVIKLQSEPCNLDIYYSFENTRYIKKITERFSPFSSDSNMIIDLHSEGTINTLIIDYSTEGDSTWTPELNTLGNSSHNPIKEMCRGDDTITNSMTFTCNKPTRFLEIVVRGRTTIHKIKKFMKYTQSELFAGCYELKKSLAVITKELTDCLTECRTNQTGYLYAGIKDNKCHCFKSTFGLTIVDSHLCSNYCPPGLLCGSDKHIPLYFSNAVMCNSLSSDCIENASNCMICPYGYFGISCMSRDCSTNKGGCGAGVCMILSEQFSEVAICSCYQGFMPSYLGPCMDIDECSVSINECANNFSKCENTVGSYRCKCSLGLKQVDDLICDDIDECSTSKACGPFKKCINTWGSYQCDCPIGYKSYNATSDCIDVDECLEFCKEGVCTNTDGSYTCKCKSGYQMTRRGICVDVNECAALQLCDPNTTACINWNGGFECICLKGYEKESSYKCIDMDECQLGLHTCGKTAGCVNSIGSFRCNCGAGYRTEIFTYATICGDIDECQDGAVCDHTTTLCINTLGSYSCTCRRGYIHADEFSCVMNIENSTTIEYEELYTAEYVEMDLSSLVRAISITLGLVTTFLVLCVGFFIKCRYFTNHPHDHADVVDFDTISTSS